MGISGTAKTLWNNVKVARSTMEEAGRSMSKAMLKRGAIGAGIGGVANTLRGGEFSDGAVAGAVIGTGTVAYKMAGLGKNVYNKGSTKFAKDAYKGYAAAWKSNANVAKGAMEQAEEAVKQAAKETTENVADTANKTAETITKNAGAAEPVSNVSRYKLRKYNGRDKVIKSDMLRDSKYFLEQEKRALKGTQTARGNAQKKVARQKLSEARDYTNLVQKTYKLKDRHMNVLRKRVDKR